MWEFITAHPWSFVIAGVVFVAALIGVTIGIIKKLG